MRELAPDSRADLCHFLGGAEAVFVLHDTTEFSYQREDTEAIGITKSINSGRDKAGRLRSHTVCGILMHSSLAVTSEGLPLGLAAIKFWTRKKFKGTAALKKKINPTRVPIEKKESVRLAAVSDAYLPPQRPTDDILASLMRTPKVALEFSEQIERMRRAVLGSSSIILIRLAIWELGL